LELKPVAAKSHMIEAAGGCAAGRGLGDAEEEEEEI
jgi:hypothetical protein